MFINHVEWIPAVEKTFIENLGLPVCMEFLVRHPIKVDFESVLKPFAFHPISTITEEFEFTAATDSPHVLNDLGAD